MLAVSTSCVGLVPSTPWGTLWSHASVARRHAPVTVSARTQYPNDEYGVNVPYKEAAYDPEAADSFYRARPLQTFRRLVQLARLSGGFVALTLLDKVLKRE